MIFMAINLLINDLKNHLFTFFVNPEILNLIFAICAGETESSEIQLII